MLQATEKLRVYDYWIYVCPAEIPFSTKHSVNRLREIVARGTKPWATITLTPDPIIDQVVRSLLKEEQELPSEVAKQALNIIIVNYQTERKKGLAEMKRRGAVTSAYSL